MSQSRVEQALESLASRALESRALAGRVASLAGRYAAVLRDGGTLFFCGNGGSAADAQHLATEYVVRYGDTRPAFSAIALTTDSSLLTAAGNDFGFDRIFARQIEALCRAGDLLVLHSTSWRSANLVCAARAARAKGVFTIAFLGRDGGPLAAEVDEAVLVPTKETSEIQVLQLALEHVIVELVEAELGSAP